MAFKRARTTEQKDIRLNQILDATEDLFKNNNYANITLQMIANKLDFTRANLYKYVPTKEDIFLLIFEKYLHLWVEDTIEVFRNKSNLSIVEFADIWSKTIEKYPIMLQIRNLLNCIIEENVSFESLVDFKSTIWHDFYRLIPIIETQLPFVEKKVLKSFITSQFFYAATLFLAVSAQERHWKAFKLCDSELEAIAFQPAFREYLCIQIHGYRSMYKNITS